MSHSNSKSARRVPAAKRHHLDRRAYQLAKEGDGANDELLTTAQVAQWLSVSFQWLEIGRLRGYGPRFRRLGPRLIRYSRGDIRRWLDERAHARTADYPRAEAGSAP
jgi:predicted DNA-binding transcriptional regulator AlpA